ncbi:hypothetical protein CH354_07215 [Leptospira levettii]|uniref:hypothetical protein n=1 Tax=Leptospira levettii TaxID=2023178 RepID=UPI000C2AE063|nr:hypothetical protein [Leptospira levettii]PJZ38960.1 hypothetical protein CH354_07215 [Leptospira levettii]PJZ90660.1 hypothetical protein CH368_00125 [Leptospira levettii]PKA02260.1 hypothetical protein CH369_03640 [Leptospira levettii]
MKPTKKILDADEFFQTKVKLEEELIHLEGLEREVNDQISKLVGLSEKLIECSESNESPYFLQRSKRLSAEILKFKIKNEYKQKEFDSLYHILDKIKSGDKIEFLDSALKNRISKIAHHMVEKKEIPKENSQISLKGNLKNQNSGKLAFICYVLEGVHFLLPKKPYRVIRNIPAFKKQIKIKDKLIPMFPGPGFILMEEGESKEKHVILMKNSDKQECGFYFDALKEDWAISKTSLDSILEKESNYKSIVGTIKRKGKRFHVINL